jgi:hypothetical protein
MKNPRMSLREIERAIAEQDRELEAAVEVLRRASGGPAVVLPLEDLERIDEACSPRPAAASTSNGFTRIRC